MRDTVPWLGILYGTVQYPRASPRVPLQYEYSRYRSTRTNSQGKSTIP